MKNRNGITLIALIITIIVLLILAGISISAIVGDNGIITKAQKSQVKTEREKEKEWLEMTVTGVLNESLKFDKKELEENIQKELPYAKLTDTEGKFPLKVVLKYGTYSINEFGKIESLRGIELDEVSIKLQIVDGVAETKELKVIKTAVEEVIWSSSNTSIAIVDNTGKVTAVGEGTAKITATCEEVVAECDVTVENIVSISSITLKINGVEVTSSTETQSIRKDATLEIIAETNSKATESIIWESSNPSIAKVEGRGTRNLKGIVTGLDLSESNEEIIITAKGLKGISKTIKVRIISVDEYINDSLILRLDGIDNTLNGHSNNTQTWYDLSNEKSNATLYNCTINNDNIEFNGSSSYATLPSNAFGVYGASTFEIVLKVENASVVFGDNYLVSRRGLGLANNNTVKTVVGGETGYYTHTTDLNLYSVIHSYVILFDGVNYNSTDVIIDGRVANRTSSKDAYSNNTKYPIIGKRSWGTSTNWALKGKIYAFRVYNRKLTQNELIQNYNSDKNRFNIQ